VGASLLLLVAGCSTIGRVVEPSGSGLGGSQIGNASWYGRRHQGLRTASGERYDEYAMTAASPVLPLGTRARVKNLENGRSVVVRVNDRGPFVDGRIIDVSYAAARALGMVGDGVARVKVIPLR
jgi:rare lipoprotein A